MVQVPEVAFGICWAKSLEGVHDTEVDVVFVTIVPLVLPKEYFNVCVKDEDALVMEIVVAEPISTSEDETDEARAMESSVIFAEQEMEL